MSRYTKEKQILEDMPYNQVQHNQQSNTVTPTDQTVSDLARVWLQKRCYNIKRSTYSGYVYCIETHILPCFGSVRLTDLTGAAILVFIENMHQKQLSDTTVRSALTIFKSILILGVQLNLLKRELLVYCSVTCRKPESKVLTVQESIHMKEYLLEKNTVFSIAILLCRGTGIRVGELCGLKWGDIDFVSNTISIKRTISRIPNPDPAEGQPRTVLYIRTPKSRTSMREVPIPQYLVNSLKAIRKEADNYFLTGLDACTEPRNVQKKFKTILKHCEMPDCNFHAMRHGFATACLEKGIDCKTVSTILGHASVRTTMDIYVHTSLKQKQECIDAIN